MARQFLSPSEIDQMAEALVKSKIDLSSFEDYSNDEGWASWMDEFTDAGDGEECTEKELDFIQKAQKEVWRQAIAIKAKRRKDLCHSLGRVTAMVKRMTDMPDRLVPKIAAQPLSLVFWLGKATIKDSDELLEVMGSIDDIPHFLTVVEQGEFWIGYYSQCKECNFRQQMGNRLKAARLSKEMSQKDVADRAGLTEATVNKIENGKWSVSLDLLEKVCSALGVTLTLAEN